MTRIYTSRLLASAIAALLSCTAQAQNVPDIRETITQGDQIADIIRDQQRRSDAKAQDGDVIDVEASVFVLQKNDIFFVSGGVSAGYEANPLRTIDDVGGSALVGLNFATGIQTVVAERFDVGLSFNASGVEYEQDFAPSSRSLSSGLSVGTQIDGTPIYVSAQAFGGWNFDQEFANAVSFYGVSAAVSAGFPIGRTTFVRPGLAATRQWTQTSENNSISATASLDLVHAITPRLTLAARGNVARIWFDDFFEDVTFVPRNDWQFGGGLSLAYRVNDRFGFGLSSSYEKRDSSFFLSSYEGFDVSATVSLLARF